VTLADWLGSLDRLPYSHVRSIKRIPVESSIQKSGWPDNGYENACFHVNYMIQHNMAKGFELPPMRDEGKNRLDG
jgi:hypothetical protein